MKRIFYVSGLILLLSSLCASLAADNNYRKRSSSAICISPDNTIVCATNPDSNSITLISTLADTVTAEIEVGSNPRTVCFTEDGKKIITANMDSGDISIINTDTLDVEKTIAIRGEPYGVIAHPAQDVVFVTNTVSSEVFAIDYRTGEVLNRLSVEPNPRGLAITQDANILYVTHFYTGRISVIDTTTFEVINIIPTLTDANFCQSIVLNLDETKAYLPHIRSFTTNKNPQFDNAVFPIVSVIDLINGLNINKERIHSDISDQPVNKPIDVVITPDGRHLYVLNAGSNDISVFALSTGNGVAHIETGGAFPMGIILDPDTNKIYVNNTLSDTVTIINTETNKVIDTIKITTSPLSDNIRNGKILFYTTDKPEITTDQWMSCGSCHFDGEHDGKTWDFGIGPRNTISLAGVSETPPLHWTPNFDEIQDFEFAIRQLQAGTGLIKGQEPNPALDTPNAGLSKDLDDLAAYVNSIKHKQGIFLNEDGSLPLPARRGRDIFLSTETGCSECHIPPLLTDSSLDNDPFIVHDVGTGDGPDEKAGADFDTPSLKGLYKSPPYLHDGSAETLEEVLSIKNPDDRHGKTSHLNPQDISDITQYLLTLDSRNEDPKQVISGLYGFIMDNDGKAIPGIQVKLRKIKSLDVMFTQSNENSLYEFDNLEAGTYILIINSDGFKRVKERVQIEFARDLRTDFTLDL